MEYKDIFVSIQEAEHILKSLFGIQGTASALPGEIDFNFRIKVDDVASYILKVSRPDEDLEYLDYQQKLLQHIEIESTNIIAPKVIKDLEGNSIASWKDKNGVHRCIRLLTWIPGRLWSAVNPISKDLRYSLGIECGLLTKALSNFDHPQAHRDFEWDIAQSLWTKEYLHLFKGKRQKIVAHFQQSFENQQAIYDQLPKSVVHNDANDNNLVVNQDLKNPRVLAAIDYGDAIYTQTINDVAIACAYAIMHFPDPLEACLSIVKGYHKSHSLKEQELTHLYDCIAMRLIISVTKSAINKIKEPDNKYLLISEKPAWGVLEKWYDISSDFAHYCFRKVCGFTAHPDEEKFKKWAAKESFSLTRLFPTVLKKEAVNIDLSVSSTWLGHQSEFNDLEHFQFKINQLQKEHPNQIIAGGYLEPRPLYTAESYDKIGNYGRESRTVHLGVDFWLPAGTPVHALFDGEVVVAVNDAGEKEYGGLIIIKHTQEDFTFYTLYGHNTVESVQKFKPGSLIRKGDQICVLADYPENGNWVPHLHFQIMLSTLGYKDDFPGVAYPQQLKIWKGLCPDPNLLFKLNSLETSNNVSDKDLISFRKEHLGKSLSLQYKVPIKMVRGNGVYLIDQYGNKYLDTVNNVAHVGHEHPAVVKAGQQQMAVLNTNSRYLHENINVLAKELLETLPPELSVLHFVNSGSEANELAIRMTKAVTGEKDIIASEVGYHGNSNMCIDISSYKFDGKGGSGAPEHTHIIPLPDAFRGKYRGKEAGSKYASEIDKAIKKIQYLGRNVSAFIIESIISCGGQIELPKGFLAKAYEIVRKEGGLCIADEVQVGCGRVGKAFWGFQLHNVVPDIVTIGKPLGNGHPIAAVACTQEVAQKFANGMEYFNTFGGNPVSCAIGAEVIKTVKREGLQEHALKIGEYLKSELKRLAMKFPIIGDVRGQGLFLGIELVDSKLNPLANHTDYLANRMKEHGILMSTDGPDHNVLKIKPPIVFSKQNAQDLIHYLNKVLSEDFMTQYE